MQPMTTARVTAPAHTPRAPGYAAAQVDVLLCSCLVLISACTLLGPGGSNEEAVAAATEALEIRPGHSQALYRRSQAYLNDGKLSEAVADARAALEACDEASEESRAKLRVHVAHLERARRDASLWWALVGTVEDGASAARGLLMAVPNRVFGPKRAPMAVGLLVVALIAAPLLRPGDGGGGSGGGVAGLFSSAVGEEVGASASASATAAASQAASGGDSGGAAAADAHDDDDDEEEEGSAGVVAWLVDSMQRTLVAAFSDGAGADDDDGDDEGGGGWLGPLVNGLRTAFGFVNLNDGEED